MKYTQTLADEYIKLWEGLSPVTTDAKKYAQKILDNKSRYMKVQDMTGVPWHFVGLVHLRESTLNFDRNLANGQPLSQKTTIVPKGRGPYKTFEESAIDSLVNVQKYKKDRDWSLPMYIWTIEGYNGYGYHSKGIPSPYLVGGSNKQQKGKYVRDGVYDPNTWDVQLGVLTVLKELVKLDPSINFGPITNKEIYVYILYGLGGRLFSAGMEDVLGATIRSVVPNVICPPARSFMSWEGVIDDIKKQPEKSRTVVVGHSLGASTATYIGSAVDVDLLVLYDLAGLPPKRVGAHVGRTLDIHDTIFDLVPEWRVQAEPGYEDRIERWTSQYGHTGQDDSFDLAKKVIVEINKLAE